MNPRMQAAITDAATRAQRDRQQIQDAVLEQVPWHCAAKVDELSDRSGFAASTLAANLMILVTTGHVRRLPGGRFQRIA